MRILIDHQVFSLETMGGMSKFYSDLIPELIKQGHEIILPVRLSNNTYLQTLAKSAYGAYFPGGIPVDPFSGISFKGKQNLLYRYNKIRFLWNYDKYLDGVDIVHMTLFDPYMVDILKRKNIPYVFHVYDLNHKTQQLKKSLLDLRMCDYAEHGIATLAKDAANIICVSKKTASDLLQYYPQIDAQKIQILYHSIDISHIYATISNLPHLDLSGPYVLYIGKRKADYKNFSRFLQAIAPLLSDKLSLVCLSHMPFDAQEQAAISQLGVSDYCFHYSGDEILKWQLLKNATAFVYPSLAEGFGIPIIEARAAGCPVLCSNITVFMEIGGGAALYFDPKNQENMRELINGVIHNTYMQDNLKTAGKERVKLFDKDREITTIIELYKTISKK